MILLIVSKFHEKEDRHMEVEKEFTINFDQRHLPIKKFRKIHLAYDKLEYVADVNLRREAEQVFLNYIALGNIAIADEMIHNTHMAEGFSFVTGKMSQNPIQQARYSIVSAITLFCRTAIDNGLPEYRAYSISDSYILYLNTFDDVEEISFLFLKAFRDYVQAMQDWKLRDCKPLLRLCQEYIMKTLHTKITLEDLSKCCHLTPNYVSDLFQKELGIRPTLYIRKEKLKYARFLLANTKNSISEIAALLAFPSSSAFTNYFRKTYGLTPTQFRNTGNY